MFKSPHLKSILLLAGLLCLLSPAHSEIISLGQSELQISYIKETPVISDRFYREISELNPQEMVKVWVFFTDKGFRDGESYLSALGRTKSLLTPRSAWRRSKTMGAELVDFNDLPVNQAYINAVDDWGGNFRNRSRWLNAASFEIPASNLQGISELDFVRSIKPLLGGTREPIEVVEPPEEESLQPEGSLLLSYGLSYPQLEQINVPAVHNLGYFGQGVIVCMLDTGYRKDHQAFQLAYSEGRVLAEWDFINNDGNTQNEAGDSTIQQNHGTYTWSAVGGAAVGNLYGPAYGAYFILAKTEDATDEQPIEEDYWVAGVEWADSIGADIVSSSLAYFEWYTYSDYNGDVAVTTIAADMAASRGIIVCNAMGNAGPALGTLQSAADADSIIACGAVYSTGEIATFSSRGPTYDGRIKPELCARGVATSCADPYNTSNYITISGTSLSTPLIGGAAALILSAHPEWTPMQVREALMMSGNRSLTPDNNYGWGIPDVLAAIQYSFRMIGDLTGNEQIDLSDAIYLLNYLFKNGPPPYSLVSGDVNCDNRLDTGDVIYLLNFLFKNGIPPCSR